MVSGKWQMGAGGWGFFEFFSVARIGILIFGGFELGLEKTRARQMIGAEWVAASRGAGRE